MSGRRKKRNTERNRNAETIIKGTILLKTLGGEKKMICPVCEMRWADFPEEDFDVSEKGIFPKNEDAAKRREKIFFSDEKEYCGCNDEYLEAMAIQASQAPIPVLKV